MLLLPPLPGKAWRTSAVKLNRHTESNSESTVLYPCGMATDGGDRAPTPRLPLWCEDVWPVIPARVKNIGQQTKPRYTSWLCQGENWLRFTFLKQTWATSISIRTFQCSQQPVMETGEQAGTVTPPMSPAQSWQHTGQPPLREHTFMEWSGRTQA